jgi:hypothetical protein
LLSLGRDTFFVLSLLHVERIGGIILEEKGYIEIPREELLAETVRFKGWSGPVLVKLFGNSGYGLYSLGSAGLIKYKNRYFVVTNEHVVKHVEKENRQNEIIIPFKDKNGNDMNAKIIDHDDNEDIDFAAFEICPTSVSEMKNHWFIDETYIELSVTDYLKRSNVVFLHGFPASQTSIDYQSRTVDMVTLPYTTFVDNYDDFSDILELTIEKRGISEFGTEIELPHLGGMSGSLVYGYYRGELIPYKCLGILSYWKENENLLGVFPIHEVIKFLDESFFHCSGI